MPTFEYPIDDLPLRDAPGWTVCGVAEVEYSRDGFDEIPWVAVKRLIDPDGEDHAVTPRLIGLLAKEALVYDRERMATIEDMAWQEADELVESYPTRRRA